MCIYVSFVFCFREMQDYWSSDFHKLHFFIKGNIQQPVSMTTEHQSNIIYLTILHGYHNKIWCWKETIKMSQTIIIISCLITIICFVISFRYFPFSCLNFNYMVISNCFWAFQMYSIHGSLIFLSSAPKVSIRTKLPGKEIGVPPSPHPHTRLSFGGDPRSSV